MFQPKQDFTHHLTFPMANRARYILTDMYLRILFVSTVYLIMMINFVFVFFFIVLSFNLICFFRSSGAFIL